MVGIVLASHGELAGGVKQAAGMVFGEIEHVAIANLEPQEGPQDYRNKLDEAISSLGNPNQLLFLADLWGGTPFNQIKLASEGRTGWITVTGLSLPMFIEAYSNMSSLESAAELAAHIFSVGRQGVRISPEGLQPKHSARPRNVSAAAALGGTGKLPEIVWCRIDSRLLHGQVAMAWTKQVQPTRIMVVSDGVAHDELRKTLITEAAPPGTKANVVPVDKIIQICKDDRFAGQRLLLLFENPQDVLRVVSAGIQIPLVNIGSMAHSAGKTMLGSAVSVDRDDVAALEALRDKGCEFCIQKVPTDRDEGLWNLLAKTAIA
ncbi:Protein-N(pi)-phosphohistidine--sugarphosphotran sferase [Coriobacterium glomerans PW2]|uniref:PTS system mannose-specific EIIAB component n=1 Tax=Coriobacterium glomerans (strain ATCC 49209 / DSM 20642 / JCM 10262 / PW2) TaxID=700015 RepID=F2N718_CORGP|nr:PTS sugar transporter subunit IIB [Coriobacterium glomerans]AEB06357.1 Protein-N(pi)-phosphohistidine--sugarphosphotran sferase [Coriobacterium glomerans PW2]